MRSEGRIWNALRQYGFEPLHVEVSPVASGFSGAGVWRITCPGQSYALKRWPDRQPAYLSLATIHDLMKAARDTGLTYVPAVLRNQLGSTSLDLHGDRWELTSWQLGQPIEAPGGQQIDGAIAAVAQLHAIWQGRAMQRAVCPGVSLRYQRLTEWTRAEMDQLRVEIRSSPLYQRAYHCWQSRRELEARRLEPWLSRRVTVQPCLGDVWSDHVLFTDEQVTGIIDYGGMRLDHPAQDLARLLGSYQLTPRVLHNALEAYPRRGSGLEELVMILMESGRVVSVGNWLRWLLLEGRLFRNLELVRRRLTRLVGAMESI